MRVLLYTERGTTPLTGQEAADMLVILDKVAFMVIFNRGTGKRDLVAGDASFFNGNACLYDGMIRRYLRTIDRDDPAIKWSALPCGSFLRESGHWNWVGAWGRMDQIAPFRELVKDELALARVA
ncbi:hypothetical protein HOI83_00450 [Candidatus Uhrbacteria bacterium]|nr:hypothetical protein [Candidatus Uhrbacteria bacterium]